MMSGEAMTFEAWMTTGHLAPYVRTARLVDGLCFLCEAHQPPGDMSDPPVQDLLFTEMLTDVEHRSDLGGGRFEAKGAAGTFVMTPPDFATTIHVRNPHAIRAMCFPKARVIPLMAGLGRRSDPLDFGRLHRGHFEHPELRHAARRLARAAMRDDAASRLLVEGLTLVILAELAALADYPPRLARGGLAPHVLRRVRERMMADLTEDIGLEELAQLAGLSPFHFVRVFKQSTGLPPQAWRQQARLDAAKGLLESTSLPVTEIALHVGYESSQALARAFRCRIGTSPTAYRRARSA
jgi:AraC family transcriptional regulator